MGKLTFAYCLETECGGVADLKACTGELVNVGMMQFAPPTNMSFLERHRVAAFAVRAGMIESGNARRTKVDEPMGQGAPRLDRRATAVAGERDVLDRDAVPGEINDEIVEFGPHQHSLFGLAAVTATAVSRAARIVARVCHIRPVRGRITGEYTTRCL